MALELLQALADKIKTDLAAASATFSITNAVYSREFVPVIVLKDQDAVPQVRLIGRGRQTEMYTKDDWRRMLVVDLVVLKKVTGQAAETNATLDPLALFCQELETYFEPYARRQLTIDGGHLATFDRSEVVTACDTHELLTNHQFAFQAKLYWEVIQ